MDRYSHQNFGGRDQIIRQIQHHQTNLMKVKPTMNTRQKVMEINKVGSIYLQDKFMNSPEFAEIRETYRRVYHARGTVDNNQPKTMKFLDTFLRHKKKNIYELEEHYKNLSSLQKRLGCIGSPDQRKKNPYDPVAYPSLFFRRVGEVDDRTNLEVYAKKLSEKYKVNKAVHEFNKAIIENDYFSNIRHIVKGGEYYPGSAHTRSRKNLSTSDYRPYSANPNGMRRNNSNDNVGQISNDTETLPVEGEQIVSKTASPKKKRPKTGKPVTYYSGRRSNSEYGSQEESYGNSSKKKRRKSRKQRNSSIGQNKATKSGKKRKKSK